MRSRQFAPGSGAVPVGDIAILAVPYPAVVAVVGQYGQALVGKTIVDISNPFDRDGFTGLLTPRDSSAAQEIAEAAPVDARVVKAFNTVFGHVPAALTPKTARWRCSSPATTPKPKRVSSFTESLGLRPLDTGGLTMAHWLEGAGLDDAPGHRQGRPGRLLPRRQRTRRAG